MSFRWILLTAALAVGVALTLPAPRIRAQGPDAAQAQYNLALRLKQAGRPAEALRAAEEAVRLRPDHAAAHFTIGGLHRQAGRLLEALVHFERVIEIELDSDEKGQFEKSVASVQGLMEACQGIAPNLK